MGLFVMCMVRKSDKIWLDEDFIQVIYLYTFVSHRETLLSEFSLFEWRGMNLFSIQNNDDVLLHSG